MRLPASSPRLGNEDIEPAKVHLVSGRDRKKKFMVIVLARVRDVCGFNLHMYFEHVVGFWWASDFAPPQFHFGGEQTMHLYKVSMTIQ